ncbi:MAG: hypothetical protein AVDCRST_MAG45-238, partial [uncultured Solirubrobacterales bacterium]
GGGKLGRASQVGSRPARALAARAPLLPRRPRSPAGPAGDLRGRRRAAVDGDRPEAEAQARGPDRASAVSAEAARGGVVRRPLRGRLEPAGVGAGDGLGRDPRSRYGRRRGHRARQAQSQVRPLSRGTPRGSVRRTEPRPGAVLEGLGGL